MIKDLLNPDGSVKATFHKKMEAGECLCKYKSSDGFYIDKKTKTVYKLVN